jgi:hypothetical protein
MNNYWTVISGLVAAGFFVLYLPHIFVIHREKFTRKQFVEQYSSFQWINSDLVIEFFAFLILIIGFAVGTYILQTRNSLAFFSIIPAGLGLINGLLTAKTGICRVPYPKMPYRYIYDATLRQMGWGQSIIGIINIVIAIGIALYEGPL